MNWLIIISHAAAERLSYYNAAEGESRNTERRARDYARIHWKLARVELRQAGLYDEFMAAGNYLI